MNDRVMIEAFVADIFRKSAKQASECCVLYSGLTTDELCLRVKIAARAHGSKMTPSGKDISEFLKAKNAMLMHHVRERGAIEYNYALFLETYSFGKDGEKAEWKRGYPEWQELRS